MASGCLVCRKRRPEPAVKDGDPFCSRECACKHHGVVYLATPSPTGLKREGESSRYGGHSRMMLPPDPERPLTNLQRARIGRDRLARAREGLKVR